MKSIIDAALERYEEKGSVAEIQDAGELATADDAMLEQLLKDLHLSIKVVGCGGGGSNTITRLMEEGIRGAELIACNTDAMHLKGVHSNRKILLGLKTTRGLGAGGDPQVGRKSAKEADEHLTAAVKGADIVFVTCGLGGGTGTGVAPYVADKAKDQGSLVVVFTTEPFKAEGMSRMETARWGINRLVSVADTVVTIPNDRLLQISPNLALDAAFHVVDELLMNSIKGIIEMVTKPGLVNIDYNDLRTIMEGMGMAVVGIGSADEREGRARLAVQRALDSPLLAYDISHARGALIKVTGGPDMTLQEAQEVAGEIQSRVDPGTRIIWGAAIEPEYEGRLSVMVVITGVESPDIHGHGEIHGEMAQGPVGGWGGPSDVDTVR